MLKNYTEIVVDELLPNILQSQNLECKCETCINDIKAIALNNLKPMYVASQKGILYSKLNEFSLQFKTDAIQELTIAISKVRENPRH